MEHKNYGEHQLSLTQILLDDLIEDEALEHQLKGHLSRWDPLKLNQMDFHHRYI